MPIRGLPLLLVAGGFALAGCHPGNAENKQLRADCAAGNVAACNTWGLHLARGRYVLQDPAQASLAFRQACDGGVAESCSELGRLHQGGRGVPQDVQRAGRVMRRSCNLGHRPACPRERPTNG